MREPSAIEPPSAPVDSATRSGGETGSREIEREIERELVRAALFDGRAAPRIGRFAVGERLGAGASSVVYAAWDDLLARRIALKIFVASSSITHRQGQREARALAQLSHRNVVAVYEVGEWNSHAFIAMELIAGTTLARWQVARERSAAEIIAAYRQAGLGLAAAHQAGLVHRDFKPTNVMVAGDDRVVVTDFGLAGSVAHEVAPGGRHASSPGSASTTRAAVGTPAYVAPEQRRGATPHPSADIYSFALALCEAMIGWHPMQRDEAAWREALSRQVPRRIYEAICTGMADPPSARGDTLAPLLAALVPRPRRRWPRDAAVALAGLAAAAVAIGVGRAGDRVPTPSPLRPPSPFGAPSLYLVRREIDAFLAAPPLAGDRAAAAALRALVLAPLPTDLPCRWPAPLVAFVLGEAHAIGLDGQGRVHACALDGGAISLAATDARCITAGPGGTIGVMDRDRRARVVRSIGAGWQAVRATLPAPEATLLPAPGWPCPIAILPRPDGSVRVVVVRGAMAVDSSGWITAIATLAELRIADPAGAELATRRLPDGRLFPLLDVSRDGARVLAAEVHGPIVWWQARTGRWQEERLYFANPSLRRTRLSPSGARALVLDYFGALEVRTLGGGRTAWLTSDAIADAVFLDDDTVIASDASHRLWRWDLADLRAGVAAIHGGPVWSVASNAEVVASGGEDGTVAVLDRRTGARRLEFHPGHGIYRIVLDGDHLLAAGEDGLWRWRWLTGEPVPLAGGHGLRLWDVARATAGDGTRIYVAGALAQAAIFASTATAQTRLHHSPRPNARISDVAVSADEHTAAAVDSTGELVVIDLFARRPPVEIAAHPGGWARHVAFDPATSTIVTAGDDGYLRTWSVPDSAPRLAVQISDGPVYGLDVQLGRAITGSYDGGVLLVDLASGQIVQRYRGHYAAVRTARFRTGGRWFVTGDNAGRACLWRIDDDACHTWLDGHRTGVLEATFADDDTIFTASQDGAVRYWRPTYDQPVGALMTELARHRAQR